MNEVFISIDILEFMMNGMLKKMQALVFHLKKSWILRVSLLNSHKLWKYMCFNLRKNISNI